MLTQEDVRKLFNYDKLTGSLIWKIRLSNRISIGDYAGSMSNKGYLTTRVKNKLYLNHRLIWLYHYGYFPENQIDHIDRDKLNNRVNNLREVSQSCNIRNTGSRKNNKSGVKGVSWHKASKSWRVNIMTNGKPNYLGYYNDKTEAVAMRLAMEQCFGWVNCDISSTAYKYMVEYVR